MAIFKGARRDVSAYFASHNVLIPAGDVLDTEKSIEDFILNIVDID
jgi:hypothetical protein